jgi:hypothetical protein
MKSDKKLVFNSLVKVLIIILILSITVNIVLLGEAAKAKKAYNAVMDDYGLKKEELEAKLKAEEKELEKICDEYYCDKLTKIVDEEALMILAQKQWNYILTVNGKEFTGDIMYSDDKNIKIVLAEICNKEKVLPHDILVKGTVTGGDSNDSIASHLDIVSLVDYNKYEDKEQYGKRMCYEFKDIPKGTIITLKISEILKQSLDLEQKINLKDNDLEIIIP